MALTVNTARLEQANLPFSATLQRREVCLCLGERNDRSNYIELMCSLKMVSVQSLTDALQKEFLVLAEHLFPLVSLLLKVSLLYLSSK